MKKIRYLFEALLVYYFYYLFRFLPIGFASWLGGSIAGSLGRFTSANKVAKENIKKCLDVKDINSLLEGVWGNLGRNIAEMSHLDKINKENYKSYIEIEGAENISASKDGAIFISAHIANWEIAPKLLSLLGIDLGLVYRKANNPFVERLIRKIRGNYSSVNIKKGGNVRDIIRLIKNKKSVGMLLDQKMNDGIEVPFFSMPAMTAPAVANLALKYNVKLIPVRVERLKGPKFRVVFYPPLSVKKTDDEKKDIFELMVRINLMIESWVRKTPSQWFWVHKRWKK